MIRGVVAIAGPHLSRRAELAALWVTALAALVTVVVPGLYTVLLPAACAAAASLVPPGRRLRVAMAVWCPLSLAVVLGTLTVG